LLCSEDGQLLISHNSALIAKRLAEKKAKVAAIKASHHKTA
jgi:hypothetical protein